MEPEGDCKPHCHWVAPDDVDTVRIDDVDPRSSSQGSKMTMSEDGAEADGGGAEADGRRAGKEERKFQFMVRRIMGYARAADAEEVQEDGASGNPQAKRHMIRLLAGGVSLTRMPWKAVLRTQCVHYIHGLRLGGCTYTYLQESLGRVPEAVLLRSADRSEGCADLWCQACKDANTSWT